MGLYELRLHVVVHLRQQVHARRLVLVFQLKQQSVSKQALEELVLQFLSVYLALRNSPLKVQGVVEIPEQAVEALDAFLVARGVVP